MCSSVPPIHITIILTCPLVSISRTIKTWYRKRNVLHQNLSRRMTKWIEQSRLTPSCSYVAILLTLFSDLRSIMMALSFVSNQSHTTIRYELQHWGSNRYRIIHRLRRTSRPAAVGVDKLPAYPNDRRWTVNVKKWRRSVIQSHVGGLILDVSKWRHLAVGGRSTTRRTTRTTRSRCTREPRWLATPTPSVLIH